MSIFPQFVILHYMFLHSKTTSTLKELLGFSRTSDNLSRCFPVLQFPSYHLIPSFYLLPQLLQVDVSLTVSAWSSVLCLDIVFWLQFGRTVWSPQASSASPVQNARLSEPSVKSRFSRLGLGIIPFTIHCGNVEQDFLLNLFDETGYLPPFHQETLNYFLSHRMEIILLFINTKFKCVGY